ncbi:MAG: peptidase and in kexin sedolisin [Gemmatimonadetes bacterium]|nr:peptidase and in kexin sedolisin [Gemmatimonadota bacterium]
MTRSLLAALLLLPTTNAKRPDNSLTYRPTSRFTVTCAAGARQCTFDGSSSDSSASGGIISYLWDWGDGRSESHTTPTASNTWQPGSYCVRLTATDRSGLTSYSTKYITLPYVAGAKVAACPAKPLTPKPDTVFRVDTIVKRDTIAMSVSIPTPLPTMSGIYVDSAMQGQAIRFFRVCLLGMGNGRPGGAVEVYPNSGWNPAANQVTVGWFASAGVKPSLALAAAQLDSTIAGCKP